MWRSREQSAAPQIVLYFLEVLDLRYVDIQQGRIQSCHSPGGSINQPRLLTHVDTGVGPGCALWRARSHPTLHVHTSVSAKLQQWERDGGVVSPVQAD